MPRKKPEEKKELAVSEKKENEKIERGQRSSVLVPYSPWYMWRNFDRMFDRFSRDFGGFTLPSERLLDREFPVISQMRTRMPYVDLEDRGNDYLLTAEMPGFKKDDVEINVTDNSVEISASAKWKYDDKAKNYVRRERASESFYRRIEVPEPIKADMVEASIKEGVLEVTLPKKVPKQKKKIQVK